MKLYTKDGITVEVHSDAEEAKLVAAGYKLVETHKTAKPEKGVK